MALSDITQHINNASTAAGSVGAQPSVRQTTLFDALNTAHRRNKRQRQADRSTRDKDSANNENISPVSIDAKGSKRICIGSPRRARAECPPSMTPPVRNLQLGSPQGKKPDHDVRRSAIPTRPAYLTFGQCSIHTAVRQRRHQAIVPSTVSMIDRLGSLVSPTARTFGLGTDDESRVGGLPLACKYSNSTGAGARLALVDESGHVRLFDTLGAVGAEGLQPAVQWKAHDNSVFDVEWSPGDDRLVTASADETSRVWDVERQQLLGTFGGHTQTVRSVSWQHGSHHCFSTASRDGSIMVWDVRSNRTAAGASAGDCVYRPVNTIARAHHDLRSSRRPARGKHSACVAGSVTAIKHLRHNASMVASAGSASEVVKFWDMRMTAPARATALPTPIASSLLASTARRSRGIASLSLDPDGTRLYAACNDNTVHVHNALSLGQALSQLGAPEFQCNSFNISTSMSPCGSYLAAGSAGGAAVVWGVDRYGHNARRARAVLAGHGKEVGCVAWYPGRDRVQLATSGDDGTLRVWDLDASLAEQGRADPMKRFCWGLSTIHREPHRL